MPHRLQQPFFPFAKPSVSYDLPAEPKEGISGCIHLVVQVGGQSHPSCDQLQSAGHPRFEKWPTLLSFTLPDPVLVVVHLFAAFFLLFRASSRC